MNTREYLNQIQRYDRAIHNKYIEIEQLKTHATGLSSFSYGERVQTSGNKDRTGDLIAEIVDLQREIQDITDEYLKKKTEVIRTIDSVRNPLQYDVLFKRYIEGKSLDIIADEVGYSYQRTKELHLCAIETVRRIKGFEY
nr:MAG TPA: Protein of unknown function (DUF1492) [Bacteriophage sp.]